MDHAGEVTAQSSRNISPYNIQSVWSQGRYPGEEGVLRVASQIFTKKETRIPTQRSRSFPDSINPRTQEYLDYPVIHVFRVVFVPLIKTIPLTCY